MAQTNPTSRSGVQAHGSACNKAMHVGTAHVGRSHKACVQKKSFRRASTCKITSGPAKPPQAAAGAVA